MKPGDGLTLIVQPEMIAAQEAARPTRRRVARYADAIQWIVDNDDIDWLTDEHAHPSVTLCLVADIFGRETEVATADLRRALYRTNAATLARIRARHSQESA